MIVGALMFISAVHINAPVTVLIIPVVMILISIPMIRVARVKTGVYYEEKTEVPTDIGMQKQGEKVDEVKEEKEG